MHSDELFSIMCRVGEKSEDGGSKMVEFYIPHFAF